MRGWKSLVGFMAVLTIANGSWGAESLKQYYGHAAVEDANGVIAPWYTGLNGLLDYRVRISMETLKRYPWVDASKAVMAAPHFVYTSMWSIDAEGNIGAPPLENWMCGDLGQRTVSLINSLADYYRYSGDASTLGFITLQADYILGYALTPADHPWPSFPISVPTKGTPYGQCQPDGFIQLDLSADIGTAILRAYQVTGDVRYFDAAKHWGDLLAQHAVIEPNKAPWNRYANPEQVQWSNQSTGSITLILRFLDRLIRLGYLGEDGALVKARDAGRAYLENVLLPAWTGVDTWGRYYWDWECPVFSLVNVWAMQYVMDARDAFPKWKTDARNILTLAYNRTGVDPGSAAEVYSGAWAIPESPSCCGNSLSYGQQLMAAGMAQYAALIRDNNARDDNARDQARRMAIMGAYDAMEDGSVIDGLTGKPIVAGTWLNIIHPLAMRSMMQTMAWLPELFGPNRENHLMRSTAEVCAIRYEKGRIDYQTFDAPENAIDVLRLAFRPTRVTGDNAPLDHLSSNEPRNGISWDNLSNGDYIVTIRHDGMKHVVVEGDDPQTVQEDKQWTFEGAWDDEKQAEALGASQRTSEEAGAVMRCMFTGNQVRLAGGVAPTGGLADVYLDGQKQRAGVDCWNQQSRYHQVLFSRSGLPNGDHELKVVVRGEKNPQSHGQRVFLDALYASTASGENNRYFEAFEEPHRLVFGYTGRDDLVDADKNTWRPGTDWILRMGNGADSVGAAWWTTPTAAAIQGTDSPELYRYGIHAPEFVVNITAEGGPHRAVLKFAASDRLDPSRNRVTVLINGKMVVEKLDVAKAAGGLHRALDLRFEDLRPRNGILEFRFIGGDKDTGQPGEAFLQAICVVNTFPDSLLNHVNLGI